MMNSRPTETKRVVINTFVPRLNRPQQGSIPPRPSRPTARTILREKKPSQAISPKRRGAPPLNTKDAESGTLEPRKKHIRGSKANENEAQKEQNAHRVEMILIEATLTSW